MKRRDVRLVLALIALGVGMWALNNYLLAPWRFGLKLRRPVVAWMLGHGVSMWLASKVSVLSAFVTAYGLAFVCGLLVGRRRPGRWLFCSLVVGGSMFASDVISGIWSGASLINWPNYWRVILTVTAHEIVVVPVCVLGAWIAARRASRRLLWAREGRCLTCGYLLRANQSGKCPECGEPSRQPETVPASIAR